MEEKLIYEIEDVKIGDIAYFEGSEKGSIVVGVDPGDDNSRLKIETPEVFKPFYLYSGPSLWLQNSFFKHAIRPTQNKLVEKSLPDVRNGHAHVFETQSGARIFYGGSKWSVEPLLGDKRLLELLDASQFPLKDITEEEESHA